MCHPDAIVQLGQAELTRVYAYYANDVLGQFQSALPLQCQACSSGTQAYNTFLLLMVVLPTVDGFAESFKDFILSRKK